MHMKTWALKMMSQTVVLGIEYLAGKKLEYLAGKKKFEYLAGKKYEYFAGKKFSTFSGGPKSVFGTGMFMSTWTPKSKIRISCWQEIQYLENFRVWGPKKGPI